jgi:hypothetical protein
MADQSGAKPPALSTDQVRAFIDRAPRCTVRIAVLCHPPAPADVIVAQLVNISKTGMFLASQDLLPIGTTVEFQFRLDDDLIALTGTAEVMRLAEQGERGMGMRFSALDSEGERMVADLVDCRPRGRRSLPGHAGPVRARLAACIVLTAATVAYFTSNPPAHRRRRVLRPLPRTTSPSGPDTSWMSSTPRAAPVPRCKAKVAAKQERRIGIRLVDVDRAEMLRLARRDREARSFGRSF